MSTHFTSLWLVVVTWHTHVHTSRQLVLHCCHFTLMSTHSTTSWHVVLTWHSHVHTLCQLVSHRHHLTHSCPNITPASITSPSLDSHMSTHFTTLWLVVVTWHTHVHTSRQLVLHCYHFTLMSTHSTTSWHVVLTWHSYVHTLCQLVSHRHHLTHSCPHITPASITSPSLDSHMSTHFTTLWLVVVTWHIHVHTSRQLVLHCCHFTHSYRHIIPPCDMLWSLDTLMSTHYAS